MAVKYIALNTQDSVSAKEISDGYDIPYELLAKVMQKLTKFKIVRSYKGVKGGYSLNSSPDMISLIEVIRAIEPNYQITKCMNEHSSEKNCRRINCCMIRDPLMKVQQEIDNIFKTMTISQII
jgi:Rrf2 family protein